MGGPGTRSRSGCFTCKKRKVKCDEVHPICSSCVSHRFSCDWPPSPGIHAKAQLTKTKKSHPPARSSRHVGDKALAARRSGRQLPAILPPPIEEPQMRCRNSLMLGPRDKEYLRFFSSTTVFAQYDFGDASCLRYLTEELAPSNSTAMNMILAISATEMQRQGLQQGDADRGLRHYALAMEDLRVGLERATDIGPKLGVDVLLVSIFLMLNYEIHYSTSTDRIKTHLAGLCALARSNAIFLRQDAGSQHQGDDGQAASLAMCCQIIVWSIYLDISMTISGSSEFLLTQLAGSAFDHRLLCANARRTNFLVWKHRYSAEQRLRDAAFARPMEFGFQVLSARFHIWDWERNGKPPLDVENHPSSWLCRLLGLQEVYADVFCLTDVAGEIPWKVGTEVSVRLVAFYWATILFYYRATGDKEMAEGFRQKIATKLANLLFVHSNKMADTHRQIGIAWPIFIAAIETTDQIHRGWLLDKLRDCRGLTSECRWLYLAAKETLG